MLSFRGVFALAAVPLVMVAVIRRRLVEPARFRDEPVGERGVPVFGAIGPRVPAAPGGGVVAGLRRGRRDRARQQLHLRLRPQRAAHVGGRDRGSWWWWPRCSGWPVSSSGRCSPTGWGAGPPRRWPWRPWRCTRILTYSGSRLALLAGYEFAVLSARHLRPGGGHARQRVVPHRGPRLGGGLERGSPAWPGRWWGSSPSAPSPTSGTASPSAPRVTFLPVLLTTALFALLPETRGREPEELWPGHGDPRDTDTATGGAQSVGPVPVVATADPRSAHGARRDPAHHRRGAGLRTRRTSPTTWCTASSTPPASRPTGGTARRGGWWSSATRPRRRRLRDIYLPGWYEYLAQGVAGLVPWAADHRRRRRAPGHRTAPSMAPAAGAGDSPSTSTRCPPCCSCSPTSVSLATVDRDSDHYTLVGGASVYPFVWSILLAARAEGLAGVLTTMVVRHEADVQGALRRARSHGGGRPRGAGPAHPPGHPATTRHPSRTSPPSTPSTAPPWPGRG